MIPVLSERPQENPASVRFLTALKNAGFSGPIDPSYASRLAVATDNSVYQLLPDAVVFPKTIDDVVLCARLLNEPTYRDVTVVPRGGGTGTNGQALAPGIVVDLSRYLAQIVETNVREGWVRVEPGVVLDDLNRTLQKERLFFAPTLSPSNRATLGGMISTNASGKGSRIYGRTADHVLELDVVLLSGTRITAREMSLEQAQSKAKQDTLEGRLYATLLEVIERDGKDIALLWPNMPRTLTGYDLKSAYRKDENSNIRVSLIPILAGSEGTLGFIVGAKLRTTPIPTVKRTVALRYAEFEDALASAEILVASDPAAIETIDARILELARKDAIWHKVSHLLDSSDQPKAVNLIEFVGNDSESVNAKIAQLVKTVREQMGSHGAATGIVVTETQNDANALWELRKKGVGLLGALKGDRRPIAFVEDTAVPPAKLSAYVRDFRKILDDAGLIYGMFGHVDVGCLHVRPALNLRDPADELKFRRISDQVVALVKRHGGVFWGEHGKGFRSEYVPEFFGVKLFSALCEIKEIFDPYGQLNPGKLAIVRHQGKSLVSVDSAKRGSFDRQIGTQSQKHFDVAIHCNGNGQCFSTDPNSVMCPSSKFTRDRVHSPKGRAALIREWLRQLGKHGVDPACDLEHAATNNSSSSNAFLVQLEGRRSHEHYDFSHEVYDALDGCLSCKSCSTQCPINVDIPRMKSEFLSLYHERYSRPLRDYFVAILENVLGFLSLIPRLFNFTMNLRWVKTFMTRIIGIVDTPLLPRRTLRSGLAERKVAYLTNDQLIKISTLTPEARADYVVIVQDAFTTFYEPEIVLAAVEILRKLGKVPIVLPFFPNGKALIIKGFLGAFKRVAGKNAKVLNRIAELKLPLLGLEPAVTLTYRDEYPAVLGTQAVQFRVQLIQEWLGTQTEKIAEIAKKSKLTTRKPLTLFGHCTEKTMAPLAEKTWERVFDAVGIDLKIPNVGCCGMCGVFGHEAIHLEESRGVYALSWQSPIRTAKSSPTDYAISGHSCRSQVHRIDGTQFAHPLTALLARLDSTTLSP